MTFSRSLTAPEMTELLKLGTVEGLLVRFYAIAGSPLDDPKGPAVDPCQFHIPADQWRELCGSIKSLDGRLAFMNVGPSGGLSR